MAAHRNLVRVFRYFNSGTTYSLTNSLRRSDYRIVHARLLHSDMSPRQLERSRGGVNLTENCVKKLKSVVSEGEMLRVTVEGGGCSGFRYTFGVDKVVNSDDSVFQRDDAKVVIDSLSLSFLEGADIDYHEELIKSSFLVKNNPNSEQGCSCGTSFSVK